MIPNERLRKAIDFIKYSHKLTNDELSQRLGYRSATYVSDILGGSKIVNKLFLDRLKIYFWVNPDWVLDGKEPMLLDNSISREMLEEEERKYLARPGKPHQDFLKSRRDSKNSSGPYLVPMVPVKARAGYVKSYDQVDFIDTLEKYALPPGISHIGAVWRYFEVDGDSMEPSFYSGDIVLGSQVPQEDWENIRNFYTYVIITEKDVWIKRVYAESRKEWIMLCENDTYKPQIIDVSEIKELWVFRRHIKKTVPMLKKLDINKIIKDLKRKPKP